MSPFFSNKKLIILLASLIILVALLGYSMRDRKLTWPEQFVNDTVGWFEFVLNKPAQSVAGFFGNIEDIKNVYQENKILKAHLDEYAALSVEKQNLERENADLKKLVHLQNDPSLSDYNKHYATVINRSFNSWDQLITVNKGAQAGIKPGMAVITADGFIGRIKHVSQFTSTVSLISDLTQTTEISASVLLPKNQEALGLIEGFNSGTGLLTLSKIPINAKLAKGQLVQTSGLGGVFPQGLVIGKVVKFEPDQFGLTQTAYIKPAADLYNLQNVVIVERLAPTGSGN